MKDIENTQVFCCVWIKYFGLTDFRANLKDISQKLFTEKYKERIVIEGVIIFEYVLLYMLYLF